MKGLMRIVLLIAGVLGISLNSGAQKPPAAKPIRPLDSAMNAMFGVHNFLQVELSPDGKRVAWVESQEGPGGAPSMNSAIYVAELSNPGAAKRISAGDGKAAHEEHDIAWSRDGKRIAFLSDAAKSGQLQLYVVDPNAKAAAKAAVAKPLTHLKGYVTGTGWSPDGKQISLLYIENATRVAGPLAAETPDEGVVSQDFLEQRVTIVDAGNGQVRQISPANMYVYEYDWAPESTKLVVTAAPGNGDDNWYFANLFALEAASGTMSPLLQKPGMQIAEPRWSPNGATIAYIGGLMSDEGSVGGEVYSVAAGGGEAKDLTPGLKASASTITWSADSSEILTGEFKDGLSAVGTVAANGGGEKVLHTFAGIFTAGDEGMRFAISGDGQTTAAIQQSFDSPPEVWAGKLGEWKQITHRNASLHPAWGKSVSLHWKTEIGSVQGWLTYPLNFDPAKKYPLVVRVHGGPSSSVTPNWPGRTSYYMALPSQGYFVLQPNPRGSYGQGEAFTRANIKDFGYGDFLDIMAGVDEALRAAPIDPNRLGITGWSYGGYMTMWAVTQTKRFQQRRLRGRASRIFRATTGKTKSISG